MYRTLRERREVDLRKARERATAAKGSVERTAIEREAAAQATAAAAAAPPAAPTSAATIPAPAPEAAPPMAPPPLEPQQPAYTPQEPAYSPPPTPPPAPPPPVQQAPVEPPPVDVLPAPPPSAGAQTSPAWEIVQPEKQDALDVQGAAAMSAGAGKASWELDPREQQRIDDRSKGRGRHGDEDEEEDTGQESLAQVLLSYAGLVAALLVILLGIFIMIGGRGPS